jgi:hypothetical protein
MPIKTIVDRDKSITVHIASGDLTFDEIAKALKSFYENSEMPEKVIWDGRNASLRNFSPLELEKIATYPTRFNSGETKIKGGMRAIVAPTDLDYGLSRVIEIVAEMAGDELPYKIKVFRSMEEATRWLKEKTDVVKI